MRGAVPLIDPVLPEEYDRLMAWADRARRLREEWRGVRRLRHGPDLPRGHLREGVGEALLLALVEQARQLGWPDVSLHAQVGAIGFYQKFGFGRLPGDLRFTLFGREFFLPLTTTIILSLVASGVAKLI